MGYIFKVDCAGQFPFTATYRFFILLSYHLPFNYFFIINEPGYLSRYSDYAYGLGGRVIGGRFPCGAKDVFRHYVLTKSKPDQSPEEGPFLWGTVTLERGSTQQQLIGIHKYIHALKNVIYIHISVT